MKSDFNNYQSLTTIVKDLKIDYPKLSEFELLSIAVEVQRNQILAAGFVISKSDTHPNGLEAIAIALGYSN